MAGAEEGCLNHSSSETNPSNDTEEEAVYQERPEVDC